MSTGIEWTNETWNPVSGCDKVSPGCAHCYAERWVGRFPERYPEGFKLTLHPARLRQPYLWRRARLIFVNSMSDLFHPDVPDDFIAEVLDVVGDTPRHTYQVLTKRPERALEVLTQYYRDHGGCPLFGGPWPNLWIGVSVENGRYLPRVDALRQMPAALRFVSFEPWLGPLGSGFPLTNLRGVDWVILGGESGPGARACPLDEVRSLVAMAQLDGASVFVKQLGERWAREMGLRGKGGEPEHWPEDLRIRQIPGQARGREVACV